MKEKGSQPLVVDHYTYGLHPQEIGGGIKAYSDERGEKANEALLERLVNSADFKKLQAQGEARSLYISEESVVISLVTATGRDRERRDGIFSHNLIVNLADYLELGARPWIFEKYFLRDINIRGKINPIAVGPPWPEETFAFDIPQTTWKIILSAIFRGLSVVVVYSGKDKATIQKIPYFTLNLLPQASRLVPYITIFPERNRSWFKLVITSEEPYIKDNGWIVINTDKPPGLSHNDDIDAAANLLVDSYFGEKQRNEEYHRIWSEIAQEHADLASCARFFVYEIETRKNGIQSFIEETIKNPAMENARDRSAFIIERIPTIPPPARFNAFLQSSLLVLSTSNITEIDDQLTKIKKAASIFTPDEQLDIARSLGSQYPSYRRKINSLMGVPAIEPKAESPKSVTIVPVAVDNFKLQDIVKSGDSLPLTGKLELYHRRLVAMEVAVLAKVLPEGDNISFIDSVLVTVYRYLCQPELRNPESDRQAAGIMGRLVEMVESMTETRLFSKPALRKDIPASVLKVIFSAEFLATMIYCLKVLKLNEDIKILEKSILNLVRVAFSLSDLDIDVSLVKDSK